MPVKCWFAWWLEGPLIDSVMMLESLTVSC